MIDKKCKIDIWTLIIVSLFLINSCAKTTEEKFVAKVKLNDSLFDGNISGKLIFLFDQDTSAQIIFGVNPDNPQPVFTFDIKNHNPKDTIFISQFTDNWYRKYSQLDGEYVYRVILDCNTTERSSFVAKGNGYSSKQKIEFQKNNRMSLNTTIDNRFSGWTFTETEKIKEIKFKSKALSNFWERDIFIESAIILPDDYEKTNTIYPVVFIFPGFGSNHASVTYGTGQIDRYGINTVGKQKIFIFMNAEFFQGYHHFVNSANNGPWGKAFTEEFIPYVETNFRISPNKSQHFLLGQSSGAWTAIWLQVNYSLLFNGAFAASPDPLDFRAHGFNIYANNSNYYFPENADSAAIGKGNHTKLTVELENILGEFGQIRTWEASFSPKNVRDEIDLLFDRETGKINPEVANYWRNYDISKIISNNPSKYRKLISGKIHICVSMDDPYELHKSVKLFEKVLNDNNINSDIQYFDGLGHNVWTDELRLNIHHIIDRN